MLPKQSLWSAPFHDAHHRPASPSGLRGLARSQTSMLAERQHRSGRSRRCTDLVVAGEPLRDPGAAPRERQRDLRARWLEPCSVPRNRSPEVVDVSVVDALAPVPRDPSLGAEARTRSKRDTSRFHFCGSLAPCSSKARSGAHSLSNRRQPPHQHASRLVSCGVMLSVRRPSRAAREPACRPVRSAGRVDPTRGPDA